MEEPICPACNNKGKITHIYKRIYKLGNLLKCDVCGLHFIWPKPFSNEKVYTKEYYNAWALREIGYEGLAGIKCATFRRVLDAVAKYKSKGSLLDVGCAFGYLSEMAKERGWDSYGIEVSEYAAKQAQEKIGTDKVMIGNFMDLVLPKDRFDVMVMVDLIEHIYDTSTVLKKCRESLKAKGLLVIVTPDIDSLSRRCLRKYWPNFNEEHLVFFSKRSVNKILDINGFRLLEMSNFKKAFNLYYIISQIRAHCRKLLILLVEIVNILIPPPLKRVIFFMLHGEILIVTQRK